MFPLWVTEWERRKHYLLWQLLALMDSSRPFIACLEEVDMFPFLSSNLTQLGFQCAFLPKPASPCLEKPDNGRPDGCALVWSGSLRALRLDALHLMDGQSYSTTPTTAITELAVPTSQPACTKVTIIGTFSPAENPTNSFRVVVTFEGQTWIQKHPRCWRCSWNEVLIIIHSIANHFCILRSVLSLGSIILKHLQENSGHRHEPTIVCGDFNAVPGEPVYERFRESGFSSAYAMCSAEGSEPPFTNCTVSAFGGFRLVSCQGFLLSY